MTRNFFPSVSRMRRIRSRAEGAERGGGKNASGPVSPGDGWARMPVQGLSGPHESRSSVFTRDRHFLLRGPTNERGQSRRGIKRESHRESLPSFSSFRRLPIPRVTDRINLHRNLLLRRGVQFLITSFETSSKSVRKGIAMELDIITRSPEREKERESNTCQPCRVRCLFKTFSKVGYHSIALSR